MSSREVPGLAVCGEIGAGLAAAALGALIVAAPDLRDAVPLMLPLGLLAAWIAWQDVRDFTIPDGAVVALACLGVAVRLADGAGVGEPYPAIVGLIALDVALCGGSLLAVREITYRQRGYDTLGLGDVKLGAAGGILLGTTGFAVALLAASLAGLAIAARLLWRGREAGATRLAFGALLAPALLIVWAISA